MPTLDPAARRALRARAHHLHPVVSIGQHGLTPAVLHEIDRALAAHELVKVRVFGDDRDARDALLEQVCAALGAAPVQHLGKLLVIWRQNPEKATPPSARRAKAPSRRASRRPTGAGTRRPATLADAPDKIRRSSSAGKPALRPGRRGSFAAPAGGASAATRGSDQARRRRARGTGESAPRPAAPAGVPRAGLPRRRRARG